jgi:hypothetical protein
MTDHPFNARAKRTYDFDTWPRRTTAPYDFWIGFHHLVAVPGYERRETYGGKDPDSSRHIAMIVLGPAGEQPDPRALLVHVVECSSDEEAREALVTELAEIMHPDRLPRGAERGVDVGEISFASREPEPGYVLFTRANVVVRIVSTGLQPITAGPAAHHLDTLLWAPAHSGTPGGTAGALALSVAEAPAGAGVTVTLPPLDESSALHLRSDAGPLRRVAGSLQLLARHPGPHDVSATYHRADGARRSAGRVTLTVDQRLDQR